MTDYIGYESLSQAALRGVVREALKIAQSEGGLPGEHHFYITFRTKAPGVKLAQYLVDRFPEDMTIVIQHQFWDLEVLDDHFEIILQFSGVPQHLYIPFAAVTRFADPSVEFGLQFTTPTGDGATVIGGVTTTPAPETADRPPEAKVAGDESADTSRPASDGTVVSLDAFRRK